ncbi:MAG: dTDP-4-dehydrorhamnose reductase [Bacteroidota bacterium]
MAKPLVVITGKNGQLGWELMQAVALVVMPFEFLFTDRTEIDLGDPSSIISFFGKYKPAYFVNCAAYTAVDKAETEQELAYTVNGESVGVIARECNKINCTLIQLSTDYVFDGTASKPYKPDSATDPVNYYGYTKWIGEKLAMENNTRTVVVRTSWVYSTHGNNFVNTMLRLMQERKELKVVSDQLGSPTYALDLANAILRIIAILEKGDHHYGVYHFSNEGIISWFDFATAIRDVAGLSCEILPQPTSAYPTPAKRPAYSVLDKTAIIQDFGITLRNWKEALEEALSKKTG